LIVGLSCIMMAPSGSRRYFGMSYSFNRSRRQFSHGEVRPEMNNRSINKKRRESPCSEESPKNVLWLLSAIILIGILVRLLFARGRLLWLDEVQTVAYIRRGLGYLLNIAGSDAGGAGSVVDVHPPLYYVMLLGWTQLWNSDLGMRMLSTLFGVTTIPVLYFFGRDLVNHRTGLLASLILALSVPHLVYSVEIRMYSLTVLLGLLSVWTFFRWVECRDNRWLGAYFVSTLACLYTYHFLVFLVGLEYIYLILVHRREQRIMKLWALVTGLLILGYIPGLIRLWTQLGFVGQGYWGLKPGMSALPSLLFWLAAGESWKAAPGQPLIIATSWLVLATLGFVRMPLNRARWLFLLGWFCLPPVGVFLLSQRAPLYQPRYFLFILPVFCLAVSGGLLSLRKPAVRLLFALALGGSSLASLLLAWEQPSRIDMNPILGAISRKGIAGETVYHISGSGGAAETFIISRYYRASSSPGEELIIGDWAKTPKEVRPIVSPENFRSSIDPSTIGSNCIWLVVSAAFLEPRQTTESLARVHLPVGFDLTNEAHTRLVDLYRCCRGNDSPRQANLGEVR
jgi:hypothetical protein